MYLSVCGGGLGAVDSNYVCITLHYAQIVLSFYNVISELTKLDQLLM